MQNPQQIALQFAGDLMAEKCPELADELMYKNGEEVLAIIDGKLGTDFAGRKNQTVLNFVYELCIALHYQLEEQK